MIYCFLTAILYRVSSQRFVATTNEETIIKKCLFSSLVSAEKGGAVSSYEMINNLSVYWCLFEKCRGYEEGGALYFYHSSGNFCGYQNCGYDCYCNDAGGGVNSGQFVYISAGTDLYFLSSSFSYCSPSLGTVKHHAISLNKGNHSVSELNSSRNYPTYFSGYLSREASEGLVSWCHFEHCISKVYTVISIMHSPITMRYSNVINCTQLENTYGLIRNYGKAFKLTDSIIDVQLPSTYYLFYQISPGTFQITSCFIMRTCKYYSITGTAQVSLTNLYPVKSFCELSIMTYHNTRVKRVQFLLFTLIYQ